MSWIAVDFDGTLAVYENWETHGETLGAPIPAMVDRVKRWLDEGQDVRILTARVCSGQDGDVLMRQINLLDAWSIEHFGVSLPLTSEKDFHMLELWDDRAVRVRKNEGEACCYHHEGGDRVRTRNEHEHFDQVFYETARMLFDAMFLEPDVLLPGSTREEKTVSWVNLDPDVNRLVSSLTHYVLRTATAFSEESKS